MSKYITNLNLPLLQYSLCPIGDLIAPSTNDMLATGYLSHQIGLVNQNDYPLQLGFEASIFKEDFLNTRVTQTSTPSTRISHTDVSCHRLPTSCHLPCLAGLYQVSSISEHLVISVVSLHLVTWPSALCAPQALKRPT